MTPHRTLVLATALACPLGLACSKNDERQPFHPVDEDTSPADVIGFDTFTPPKDSAPDGADAGPTDADGGGDGALKAACPKGWSDLKPTAVTYPGSSTKGQQLAAVTWDELTMAWFTGDTSSGVVIHYADRSDRDAAFTSEKTLPSTLGPFPAEKVALSADGLTMIYASLDHKTLRQITRTSRTAAFDETTATTAPFKLLMVVGGEGGTAREAADLVMSKDGNWLFFTDLKRTVGTSTMLSVKTFDGTWDKPNPIDDPKLQVTAGRRRRPMGISADNRTVFFYDESTDTEFAAFMDDPKSVLFTEFYPFVPNGSGASPTEKCDRVYLTYKNIPDVDAGPDARPDADPPAIYHAP